MPESARNGAIALWALAAISAAVGLALFVRTLLRLARGRRARGEVTRIERDSGEFPVVVFQPIEGGAPVTFTGNQTPKRWREGDAVDVVYDPSKPERAWIATFGQIWAPVLACVVSAAILAALGALFAFGSSY